VRFRDRQLCRRLFRTLGKILGRFSMAFARIPQWARPDEDNKNNSSKFRATMMAM
jgi:hypothetical protein